MFEFIVGVLLAIVVVMAFDGFFEWRKRVKRRAVAGHRPPGSVVDHGKQAA